MTSMLVVLTLFATVPVEVAPVTGATWQAELQALSSDAATLISADGSINPWPLEQIKALTWKNANGNDSPAPGDLSITVTLTDGSVLRVDEFETTTDKILVRSRISTASPVQIPRTQVRAVQFQAHQRDSAKQWDSFLAERRPSDMLIIPRADGRLQAIDGILAEINDENVRFNYDQEWMEVRRSKPFGLLYYTPGVPQNFSPRGQLICRDGSKLQVSMFQSHDGHLSVTTANGTQLNVPLAQLERLNLELLSVIYLSDLEPERVEQSQRLQIPQLAELEQQWFAPQRDQRLSGEPLELTINDVTQRFPKGLGLHSNTQLVYRTAGDYRRFQAIAALDPTDGAAEATLVIEADGKSVQQIELRSDTAPARIDLDLSGVNRLTVRVAYGDRSELGDHVSLCDAKFLK